MKKFLSTLIALALTISLIPSVAVYAVEPPLFPGEVCSPLLPGETCSPIISPKGIETTKEHKSWGTARVGADVLSTKLAQSGRDDEIIIAVVDTGVNSNHPYLQGRLVPGRNTTNGDYYNSEDDNGHGTMMAGIVVDATLELPNVKIMPIKVSSGSKWDIDWLVEGIDEAIYHGVDVINLSLGLEVLEGNPKNAVNVARFETALRKAVNNGITVVAAAGNENQNSSHLTPARMTEVITVAACDSNDNIPTFSNFGSSVDVAAPGCAIISSHKNGYASADGTSPAAALVSAICAMIKLNDQSLSPSQIKNTLISYSENQHSSSGWDQNYGWGIPNVRNMPVHLVSTPQPGGNKNIENYIDVRGHWAETAIAEMIPSGVVSGYSIAGGRYEFLPAKTITRAEFVKMLAVLSGDYISNVAYSPAGDIPVDSWFTPYFAWAVKSEIVKGYDDGGLHPNDNITRQEMAVILARYAEHTGTDLPSGDLWSWSANPQNQLKDDRQIADWAIESMMLMRKSGVITGDDWGNCNPSNSATRAESVTMVWKFSKL